MANRWIQAVLIVVASVLVTQGVGCASLTTDEVAGVYDLDSVVVHYGERWELEEDTTDDELGLIVGSYLQSIRGRQLHLRPNGSFIIPYGEPPTSGTWTIEANRVVGYEVGQDAMLQRVETRYEAEWIDGVLSIPSNDSDFPVDHVFVKRESGGTSPDPAQSD